MTDELPRPKMMRRVWVPGIQYGNETPEQMEAREARCLAEDASIDAEEARLWKWKKTPLWEL